MIKFQRIKYFMVFMAIVGLSIGPVACKEQGKANSSSQEIGKVIKLKIGKMTCGSCAYSAKTALQKVKHVVKAEVSFDTKTGKVYLQKGKSVNVNDLIKALERIGYTAKLIS